MPSNPSDRPSPRRSPVAHVPGPKRSRYRDARELAVAPRDNPFGGGASGGAFILLWVGCTLLLALLVVGLILLLAWWLG